MTASVKGFGCRPVVTYRAVVGPASESLRGRNLRAAGGRCAALWGFDQAAASARDERGGVVEGGLPSTIENCSAAALDGVIQQQSAASHRRSQGHGATGCDTRSVLRRVADAIK